MSGRFLRRVYSDYFRPSRLAEYAKLLKSIQDSGYEIVSVIDYFQRLKDKTISDSDRILINRHDIDTDSKTARRFFQIEQKLGVNASYYFRLGTFDYDLMKEISAYGSEASYHFEEVATCAKRNRWKSKEDINTHLDEIRCEFKENFGLLESRLDYKLRSVASHGDFVNRALGIMNHSITNKRSLRKELGIEVEAYDRLLFSSFDAYLSDRPPPVKFVPTTPIDAISNNDMKICMLTHPRQWYSSFVANNKENYIRAVEGVKWLR